MKHARKWLACLLAGALALAVLAGCSALMGGTVQKDTEQAKALMKEVDPSLTYNTDLEDAASRMADWLYPAWHRSRWSWAPCVSAGRTGWSAGWSPPP